MTARNQARPEKPRTLKITVEVHEHTDPQHSYRADVGRMEFVGTEGMVDVDGVAGTVAHAAGMLLGRPRLPEPPAAPESAPDTSDLDALPI